MKQISLFACLLFCLSLFAPSARAQSEEMTRDIIKKYETAKESGLQVTVYLQGGDGSLQPVDPQQDFHQGDGVKINIESNFRGYLYIINHGASGTKRLIFPGGTESNRIEPRQSYLLPRTYELAFDETAGFETLQVIVSRNRLPVFDAALREPEGILNEAQIAAAARYWRDQQKDQSGISVDETSRNPTWDKRKKLTIVLTNRSSAAMGIKLKNAGTRR
jgi:hypothetical protein